MAEGVRIPLSPHSLSITIIYISVRLFRHLLIRNVNECSSLSSTTILAFFFPDSPKSSH